MARYWARFGKDARARLTEFLDGVYSPTAAPPAVDSLYADYAKFCDQQSIWPLGKDSFGAVYKSKSAEAGAELQRWLRSAPPSAFRTPDACRVSLDQWCARARAWLMDDATFREVFDQVRLERDPAETEQMVKRFVEHLRKVRAAESFDVPESEAVLAWSRDHQDWEPCDRRRLYDVLNGRICARCLSFEGDTVITFCTRWGVASDRTCHNCRRSFCPTCMRTLSVVESNDCPVCHGHFRFHFASTPTGGGADWRTNCTSCGAPLGYIVTMGTTCERCRSQQAWNAQADAARRDDYWRRYQERQ